MKKPTLFEAYIFLCFAVIFAAFSLFFFWEFYPYHVSDYQQPIVILNENHTIKGGNPIRWEIKVKIYGVYRYDTRLEIVPKDGQIGCDYKLLQSISGVTEVKTYDRINASHIVPKYFKPCIYNVFITTVYHLNPLRDFTITKNTEDFKVIN